MESELRFAHSPYSIKWHKETTGPGTWEICKVSVYNSDVKVGEYTYNYPSPNNTFWPFEQNGKWYALYSEDYVATSVMSLPDCKRIAGEEGKSWGFCPVHLYVPTEMKGKFGFVAGCIWGDDTSWKIQFLDLRQITQGILIRDDRFGYISMGAETLPECITIDVEDDGKDEYVIRIKSESTFATWHREEGCYVYINGEPDERTQAKIALRK